MDKPDLVQTGRASRLLGTVVDAHANLTRRQTRAGRTDVGKFYDWQ